MLVAEDFARSLGFEPDPYVVALLPFERNRAERFRKVVGVAFCAVWTIKYTPNLSDILCGFFQHKIGRRDLHSDVIPRDFLRVPRREQRTISPSLIRRKVPQIRLTDLLAEIVVPPPRKTPTGGRLAPVISLSGPGAEFEVPREAQPLDYQI